MSAVTVESYLRVSECGIVAAAALLAFDYCLTFGQEVDWLHGTRWTAARIHFTSSRYLPFVAVAMAISTSLSADSYCGSLGTATNVVYYLSIVLAEAILIVRTYAFWRRNRKILVGMCTFGVVCMALAIIISETIGSQPTNSVYKALKCIGVESTIATVIQYVFLIVYEMGMLALNWIAYWRMTRRNPPGRLITTLYRDGVMYMAVILVFSITNAAVTLAMPVQYSDILNSPQVVMHSILASRLFFNLRETARCEQGSLHSIPLTEFRVAQQESGGFSSTLGTLSSSSRIDPAETNGTERVIEITREPVAQG